jgi:hypothetical protein
MVNLNDFNRLAANFGQSTAAAVAPDTIPSDVDKLLA